MSLRRFRRALLTLTLVTACVPPAPFVPDDFVPVPEADPGRVEAVLFLVGDAGEARLETTPLVHRLRADVERWSGELAGDSSVAVVFLGDNIYPVGLRPRDDDDFPEDSARLQAQIWTVSGPEARADGVRGLFLPGNHDWGSRRGDEGRARLRNQGRFLRAVADAGGPAVGMAPRAGGAGPEIVPLGGAARLILLDSQWWLQSEDPEEQAAMLAALEQALQTPDDRPAIVAAHHPFATGGPHAARPLDPFGILARSGAIVQDLDSEPYEAFRDSVARVFRTAGPPMVYAAGHDHSLQVIERREPGDPEWILVSGSGSKLTGVTGIPGMVWAESAPGYMRLVFRRSGAVDLYVERVDPAYQQCQVPQEELARCLDEGEAAFTEGYSTRLR